MTKRRREKEAEGGRRGSGVKRRGGTGGAASMNARWSERRKERLAGPQNSGFGREMWGGLRLWLSPVPAPRAPATYTVHRTPYRPPPFHACLQPSPSPSPLRTPPAARRPTLAAARRRLHAFCRRDHTSCRISRSHVLPHLASRLSPPRATQRPLYLLPRLPPPPASARLASRRPPPAARRPCYAFPRLPTCRTSVRATAARFASSLPRPPPAVTPTRLPPSPLHALSMHQPTSAASAPAASHHHVTPRPAPRPRIHPARRRRRPPPYLLFPFLCRARLRPQPRTGARSPELVVKRRRHALAPRR